MNWLIPSYYSNSRYINTKCPYCGSEVILNPNIKTSDGILKLINLDHSPHRCHENKWFMLQNAYENTINNYRGSN